MRNKTYSCKFVFYGEVIFQYQQSEQNYEFTDVIFLSYWRLRSVTVLIIIIISNLHSNLRERLLCGVCVLHAGRDSNTVFMTYWEILF